VGQRLHADFIGLTKDTVELDVPAGTFLQCALVGSQNFFVTRGLTVVVYGGQTAARALYVMCGNQAKRSPQISTSFSLRLWKGTSHVLELCHAIDSLNIQDMCGQSALCTLLAGGHHSAIVGYRMQAANTLRSLVATRLHQSFTNPFAGISVEDRDDSPLRTAVAGSTVNWVAMANSL
jgi:hypothetical protein